MKKIFFPLLLASALCMSLAGCGGNNENNENTEDRGVTITENTDPKALVGQQVDRTAWQAAFETEENYTVKTVVTADIMQNGDTMSENVTLVYRFTPDKYFLTVGMKEGNKTTFEAEAYMELEGDTVSMWQRAKEGGTWSEWDGETYPKEDLGEIFGLTNDLTFLKNNYANFAYVETDKGYVATMSGLAEMQDALNEFAQSIFGMIGGDSLNLDLGKFVLKLNGGKVGACLVDLTIEEAQAPEARIGEEDTAPAPDESQQPDGEGDAEDGPEETAPEQPMRGTVKLTQIFYDYGKTEVNRPDGIAQEPSEDDAPNATPEDPTDPEQRLIK